MKPSKRLTLFLAVNFALLGCVSTSAPSIAWNGTALADVAAYAQSQKTTGLLIMQRGQVIAEHNWPLSAADSRFAANWTHGKDSHGGLQEDVASAQKSLIALLAGIAVDKGLLDVSQAVSYYVPAGWSRATLQQEQAITVRHLLEMSSGLSEKLGFEAPAGAKFFYNTPAYALLQPVLEAASQQTLDAMTRAWLTQALGMEDTQWRQRPASLGDVGNPRGLYSTPRDMAKLGHLLLNQGRSASGKTVISETQLSAMLARTATNPAYGRLWWLNGSVYTLRADGSRLDSALIPAAPADLVMALGALDRKIYVSASRQLVVVRTGQAAPDKDFNQQLWLRLSKAYAQ